MFISQAKDMSATQKQQQSSSRKRRRTSKEEDEEETQEQWVARVLEYDRKKKEEEARKNTIMERTRRICAYTAMLLEHFLPREVENASEKRLQIGSELTEIVRQIDAKRINRKDYYRGTGAFEQFEMPTWIKNCMDSIDTNTPIGYVIPFFFREMIHVALLIMEDPTIFPGQQFLGDFCLDRMREMAYTMLRFFPLAGSKYEDTFRDNSSSWMGNAVVPMMRRLRKNKYLRPLNYNTWFCHGDGKEF